jgi:UDP-N-acetyl-D-glucosamine dehydrogenase
MPAEGKKPRHGAFYERTLASTRACSDHSSYDWDWILAHAPLVVDTRNATRHVSIGRERIILA